MGNDRERGGSMATVALNGERALWVTRSRRRFTQPVRILPTHCGKGQNFRFSVADSGLGTAPLPRCLVGREA